MAKKKTAAQKRIEAAPASEFRRLSKTELEKLGYSSKSARYIEIGKRIARGVKTISKRLFTVKKTGASPEAMARAHAEGELIYKSRKTQAAAEKQRKSRLEQKTKRNAKLELELADKKYKPFSAKQAERAAFNFEKKVSNLKYAQPGARARDTRSWRISQLSRDQAVDVYRRKLGDPSYWAPNGDYHNMLDIARAAGDPNIGRLLQSKSDKRSRDDLRLR